MAVGKVNVGSEKKQEINVGGFAGGTRIIVATKGNRVATAIDKNQYLYDNKGNLLVSKAITTIAPMSNTEYYAVRNTENTGYDIYDWSDNLIIANTNLFSSINDGQRTFKRMDNGDFVCFRHTTSTKPTVYDHNDNLLATAPSNLINDSIANVFSFVGYNDVLCLYSNKNDGTGNLMFYNHKTNTIEVGTTGNSKILMPVLQV